MVARMTGWRGTLPRVMGLQYCQLTILAAIVALGSVATATASSRGEVFGSSERVLAAQTTVLSGVEFDPLFRGAVAHLTSKVTILASPFGFEYHESTIRRQLAVSGLFTSRPLAVKSDRRDPTNKFRRYRNGFDVTSKHYWASVAFTGVYGYAIGAAWLLLGLGLALATCCRRKKSEPQEHHSSIFYWIPSLLVLLLSLFAIGCVIVLFVLNQRAWSQTTKVKNTVVEAKTVVTDTIHNVTATLGRVEVQIEKYNIPGWQTLNSTEVELNEQAGLVTAKIDRRLRQFNRIIHAVKLAVIIILSVILFLIVAGLVATFTGLRKLFFLIILLLWILTTITWLLFGLLYALNNAASDTCQALNEFLVAPVNTTLDNFLPCVDSNSSATALREVRESIGSIINEANSTIITIQKLNNFLGIGNGSLLSLCDNIGDPPDYAYNATCQAGTLPIGDLPSVLAPYVCLKNMSTLDCLTDGRFVSAANNASFYEFSDGAQSMLNTLPKLSKLADCSFVTDTFSNFVNRRCRPLKSALRHLWILTLLLSIFLTTLTALWLLARHRNTHQRRMDSVHRYVGK